MTTHSQHILTMGCLKYCWIIGLIFGLDNLLQKSKADDYPALTGNYGSKGMDSIPNIRLNRRENSKAVRPQSNHPAREKDVTQSSCKDYKGVIKEYESSYKEVLQKSKVSITDNDIKEKVDACKTELAKCTEATIDDHVGCYMDCLVKDDKLYFPVVNVMHNTLLQFCFPTHTLYTRLFVPGANGLPHLKTYRKFLDSLNVTYNTFDQTINQFSDALSVIIIKQTQTYLSPLRSVVAKMESAVVTQQGVDAYGAQTNPKCSTLEKWDAALDLVAVLTKDGATADILTPGLALWSVMSKSISSRVTQHMAVLRETMRMFTGTTTGFACNAGTGSGSGGGGDGSDGDGGSEGGGSGGLPEADHTNFKGDAAKGNCDELGKYPLPGFPIPPQVCGRYMSLLNPTCEKRDDSLVIDGGGEGGETTEGGGAGTGGETTEAPELVTSSTEPTEGGPEVSE